MIRVVTDSTSDILPEEAQRLGVDVVPLTVRFGDQQYRDGLDLRPDEFYARLRHDSATPSTSQPTPEQFAEVYRRHLDSGDSIVSVHISSKLSGTLQSASLAAQDMPAGRVRVVDSCTVSAGMQFLVRDALAAISAGCHLEETACRIEERRHRVQVYVLLDTLTYLQRGGRIGRAQTLLGSLLNVKPLLRISDGEVSPHSRVRSQRQGAEKLLQLARAESSLEQLAAFHCGAAELLGLIDAPLREMHPDLELITGQLGAVVGTYSGPGGLGIGFLRGA